MDIVIVELTQDEYLRLLRKQTDPEKRNRMKVCAFGAMYGNNLGAKILMPLYLIEGLEAPRPLSDGEAGGETRPRKPDGD